MNSDHRPMAASATPPSQTPAGLNRLLGSVANGDRSAFAVLYKTTSRKIFGILLRLLKRQDWAEDLLQDTYVKIWQRAASFDPEKASAITWMATIARNGALDELRKHNPNEVSDDTTMAQLFDQQANPRVDVERSQEWLQLEACLQGLGDTQAAMIRQAYLDGASRQHLAEQFEQPVSTVKNWLYRGLGQLRRCMGGS